MIFLCEIDDDVHIYLRLSQRGTFFIWINVEGEASRSGQAFIFYFL